MSRTSTICAHILCRTPLGLQSRPQQIYFPTHNGSPLGTISPDWVEDARRVFVLYMATVLAGRRHISGVFPSTVQDSWAKGSNPTVLLSENLHYGTDDM